MELKDLRRQLANLEKEDILKIFGVEERRSTMDVILPALGLFGVGVLVGAGIGLMMAPKSGRELREDLRQRIQAGQQGSEPRRAGMGAPAVHAEAARSA